MMLATSYDSGEELWTCDHCDRTLSIRWKPFRRTVITRGDDNVPHHGTKGELTMTVRVQQD